MARAAASLEANGGPGLPADVVGNAWEEDPDASANALPEIPAKGAVRRGGASSWSALPMEVDRSPKRSPSRRLLQQAGSTVRLVVRITGVGLVAAAFAVAVTSWPPWVIYDEGKRHLVMSTLFILGLLIVAMEEVVGINKSAVMLFLAATMWTFLAVGYHPNDSQAGAKKLNHELDRGLQDVGSVILFLLPAMGVVEAIDHFDGFALVTLTIRAGMRGHQDRLMPIICIFTFLLSSIIDNLTATILALKILRHLAETEEYRKLCGGLVVLAANAGGAWSPVGDVTTTMLWIQGKITTTKTVSWLCLPALVAGVLPLVGVGWQTWHRGRVGAAEAREVRVGDDGELEAQPEQEEEKFLRVPSGQAHNHSEDVTATKVMVLAFGIMSILLVPVLKTWTGLPPYLGMLLALGSMWLLTDNLPHEVQAEKASSPARDAESTTSSGPSQEGVVAALHKVDLSGLLFFTGVLLAVGALDSAGVLRRYAISLVSLCHGSPAALCTLLGLSSAVVDNVPLVQAAVDMFKEVGTDDPLWHLVALASGTGGSILSIGSISGVTLMSMEGVSFVWYLRRITPWAILGFFSGIGVYQIERALVGS